MSVTETFADMNASSLLMVIRSRTFGMLCSVTFSAVSSDAAMTGKAEFLAPLIATVPSSGLPPLIRNLSVDRLLSQRLTQISLRASQPGARMLGVQSQPQHDQRYSHVVSGLTQSEFGRGHVRAAGFGQDAQPAVAQLLIRQHDVDHQVLVDVPESNH